MTRVAVPCGAGAFESRQSLGGERGVATGLVAVGLLMLSVFVVAGLAALLFQVNAHRVQGAADLVALTAAQAKNQGTGDPCAAASRAAAAEDVTLISCHVGGGQLAFAVTVKVSGGGGKALLGFPLRVEASSHAGVPVAP